MRNAKVSIAVFVLSCIARAQSTCAEVDLQQHWDQETKEQFWFTSQGSQMLPYSWFLALEQASSTAPFRDPANMDRLRYIQGPSSSRNPDNLPIGFVKDVDRATNIAYVGLTCAACHTAKLNLGTTEVLVEGAPALSDFSTFLAELVDALTATLESDEKFDRFAQKVSPSQKELLRQQLEAETSALRLRKQQNTPTDPYGYGRVDAFGHILNQVLAYDLDIAGNTRVSNAPVSYPFLWDTPQHDFVQWNGAAQNTKTLGIGPLARNIGEVLGVFGKVDVQPRPNSVPSYNSSIPGENLKQLEDWVKTLWSPVWPKKCFPINQALSNAGKSVYEKACFNCHPVLNRTDPKRKIKAKLVPTSEVGTDPTMAMNFILRVAETGRLQGTPKMVNLFEKKGKFGAQAQGQEILKNVVFGVFVGQFFAPPRITSETEVTFGGSTLSDIIATMDTMTNAQARYKARPLDGIWATAPYLHNGSVPNLRELLKPPADRARTFYVGSRDFDPVNIGLTSSSGGFLFDTTKPGNSNQGHAYGTGLSAADKDALLEYLKTISDPVQ